ncbi:MAG: hypothetical protein JWR88_1042 [Pseudonocardia sp.]|nr:hypothetical protein [Pseudonocardia sp.]
MTRTTDEQDDPGARIAGGLRTIAHLWQPALLAGQRPGSKAQIHMQFGSRPPLVIKALDVRAATTDAVALWAWIVITARDLHPQLTMRQTDLIARWLIPHAAWIGGLTTAHAALLWHDALDGLGIRLHPDNAAPADLADVAHALERFVHPNPSSRRYLGTCGAGGCDAELWASRGADAIVCRTCGTVYDVAQRRSAMLEVAREQLFTKAEITHLLPTLLDQKITRKQLDHWSAKRRIIASGVDAEGVPVFLLGDVIDYVEQAASASERRRAS